MRLFVVLTLIILVGIGAASRLDSLRRNAQWQKLSDFFSQASAQGENGNDAAEVPVPTGNPSADVSGDREELFGTLQRKGTQLPGSDADTQQGAGNVGSVPLRSLYERVAVNNALLQSLSERTERLDEREKTLQARETVLAALQKKVEEREGALQKTRGEIETLLERYEGEQSGGLQQLIGIYSTIEPKRAAAIFNELDLDIVVSLLRRMPSRRVAPILAAMDAEKARRITLELSE